MKTRVLWRHCILTLILRLLLKPGVCVSLFYRSFIERSSIV